ncbi:MAG: DUF2262 domain-containing protein [Pseudomonadota bacterium]
MPNDINHPILGSLKYDEGLNWYSAHLGPIEIPRLYLSLDDCADEAAFIEFASRKVASLPTDIATARKTAVRLLDLAKGEWLPDGASTRDVDSFIAKLTVESLTLYPDESSVVIFRAADLFAGHGVLVTLEPNGQASDATLCG